jgi:4-amino-4-deoxy-L-arabinose transferase-like glycosyltransferase
MMDHASSGRTSRYHRWRWLILVGIVVVTAVFLLLFALNWYPAMRGPDEWRWPIAIPGEPLRHLVPALVLVVYAASALKWGRALLDGERPLPHTPVTYLVFIWLAIPLIQLALLWPDRYAIIRPLFFRTISSGASGVFTVGSHIGNTTDFLTRYTELMPTFPVHPQRYPPGLPLLIHGGQRLFAQFPRLSDQIGYYFRLYQCRDLALMSLPNSALAAATVQMLLPLFSGLVVFPLYGLARRALGRETAVYTVALYPLIPSFALWAAIWDQFYPLLAVMAWYFFYMGLTGRRRSLIGLAGMIISVASFLTFGILALLVPMGLWALFWLLLNGRERNWRAILLDGCFFFLGVISVWAIVQIVFGTSFWEIWQVSMGFHLGLGLNYKKWVWLHLYDFGIFLSIPLLILTVIGLLLAVRDSWLRHWQPFILAFGLGLLLLDISGMSQGEVSRVWLFLTPFAVITAVWGQLRLFRKPRAMAVILGLMVIQLLIFNAFLRILTTGVADPVPREVVYTTPAFANPLDVQFGEEVRLLGYELEETAVSPSRPLHLTLFWKSLQPMNHPYTVFTQLLGPDNQVIAQQDNMPVQNSLPTTCWLPGEVVSDPYVLNIGPDVLPGSYTLVTGLYQLETGERLTPAGPGATSDKLVILGQLWIK